MNTDIIVEALASDGYIVLSDTVEEALLVQLFQHVIALPDSTFQLAKIGRQQNQQQLLTIRNDKTVWLSDKALVEQAYLTVMQSMMMSLNRQLFLGLRSFEAHFAHYPIGHFYQRHLDAFRGESNRILSSVLYLNHDWQDSDGGQLVLYQSDNSELLRIQPKWGQLVLFMSEQFPHEVLVSTRDRYSIAGWFRQDKPL